MVILFFAVSAIFINTYFRPFLVFMFMLLIALPFDSFLEKKIKNSSIRATISIILINLIVVLLIFSIGGLFYSRISELMKSGMVNLLNNIKILIVNIEKNGEYHELLMKLYSLFTNFSGVILTRSLTVTSSGISYYLFANIILFFSLRDRKMIVRFLRKIFGDKAVVFAKQRVNDVKSYFKIQLGLIIFSMIEVSIGFTILGIGDSISYGIICGVLDLLPIVGVLMVYIPLIAINIYYGNLIVATGLIFMYICIAIIREFLQSKFGADMLQIHPLVLFTSVYVGFKLQGITGAIMMILCAITINNLLLTDESYKSFR